MGRLIPGRAFAAHCTLIGDGPAKGRGPVRSLGQLGATMSLTERYAARQHGFTRTVRRSAVGLLMALLVRAYHLEWPRRRSRAPTRQVLSPAAGRLPRQRWRLVREPAPTGARRMARTARRACSATTRSGRAGPMTQSGRRRLIRTGRRLFSASSCPSDFCGQFIDFLRFLVRMSTALLWFPCITRLTRRLRSEIPDHRACRSRATS